MIVVMGLGNPGRPYARSRHNVGFQCVDQLSRHYGIPLQERRRHAVLGQGVISGEEVVLVRPRTYVNRSGVAAGYLRDRYHITPESLLVVYDDMDLPIGKVRIRAQGSSAGHRGIESIIAELGTRDFPRIRIGVGHPEGTDIIPHVLGPFNAEEAAAMEEAIGRVTEAVGYIAEHGLNAAMNRYN